MFGNIERFCIVLFSLAVIWIVSSPAASAQVWDKKTTITVSEPFEIPGKVLPAGTYVMRIVDAAGVRTVVRFFSADEKKVHWTVIGIPDFRLDAPAKTDISFYESPVGVPLPMHAWFYPGSQFGIEFAYPKRRAAEIAATSEFHVPALDVPSMPAQIPELTIEELLEEPLIVIEPGGEEVEVAEAHPEAESVVQAAEAITPELPKTATPLPLLALIGLLAAAAASGLRFRK
jgi:hypothetical protein